VRTLAVDSGQEAAARGDRLTDTGELHGDVAAQQIRGAAHVNIPSM
jgi:hypothetical protein